MRVSDKIGVEEIKSWENGDVVTIQAGTGRGKSYFVKNTLYEHAKSNGERILMLLHRKNTLDQFSMEIHSDSKDGVIKLVTYQKVESLATKLRSFDLNKYKYIICDEFHYFMSDAAFNKYTDISLNRILGTNSIKVLMSATGDYVKEYINQIKGNDTIDYSFPADYEFIKQLRFFHKKHTFNDLLDEAISNEDKTILFMDSAQDALELHKKYKDKSMFVCSKSNKLYRHVDEEKLNQLLYEEKFHDLILITTTALDAGVNINDHSLHNIICDVRDIGTLTQCIGRKRLQDEDDYINLTIKSVTNQVLGGMKTQAQKKLEKANYLRKNSVEDYVKKYGKESDNFHLVYDVAVDGYKDKSTKKVNDLIYYKTRVDISIINKMRKLGKFGYCKYIAKEFGFYLPEFKLYDYVVIEEENKSKTLEEYLEENLGEVMLTSTDRKELIEKINVKQNGKLLKSKNILNAALDEQGFNYYIKQFQTSRVVNGKKKNFKSAWKIMKLVDE